MTLELEPPCESPSCPLRDLPLDGEDVHQQAAEYVKQIEERMNAYNRFFHAMYGTQDTEPTGLRPSSEETN